MIPQLSKISSRMQTEGGGDPMLANHSFLRRMFIDCSKYFASSSYSEYSAVQSPYFCFFPSARTKPDVNPAPFDLISVYASPKTFCNFCVSSLTGISESASS